MLISEKAHRNIPFKYAITLRLYVRNEAHKNIPLKYATTLRLYVRNEARFHYRNISIIAFVEPFLNKKG